MMSFLLSLLVCLGFTICGCLEIASTTGVDVLLQILWTFFSTAAGSTYTNSFGGEPVKTMTKILFVRHIVFNATTLYFDREKRVFSKRVAEYMAGAYAIGAVLGMFGYVHMTERTLRLFLGISSLVFLAIAVLHLGRKIMENRKQRAEVRDSGVPLSRECDFFVAGRPAMFTAGGVIRKPVAAESLGATATGAASRTDFVFPKNWKDGEAGRSGSGGAAPPSSSSGRGGEERASPAVGLTNVRRWAGGSSRPPPLSEAFLSAVTNEIFYSSEAGMPEILEDYVPPLTPHKLSPSATMTFTQVRINRVLRDGFIGKWYWIGGIVCGAVAGLLSSLVGVSSPVIFLFVSTLDLPSYLFMNIIAAHELPGSVIRFLLALYSGLYSARDILYVLVFMMTYFSGMYLTRSDRHKGLGTRSTWLYFCGLLLCQASILISQSSSTLLFALLGCFVIVSVSTYFEKSKVRMQLQFHYEVQEQRERRQREALEELQRDHSHILQRIKGGEATVPYWAGFDNDDDREYPATSPVTRRAPHSLPGAAVGGERPAMDTAGLDSHPIASPISNASLKSCDEMHEDQDHFSGTDIVVLEDSSMRERHTTLENNERGEGVLE